MFDLLKIQKAAEKLGLELEFNSATPGIHIINDEGKMKTTTFDSLNADFMNEFKTNSIKRSFSYSLGLWQTAIYSDEEALISISSIPNTLSNTQKNQKNKLNIEFSSNTKKSDTFNLKIGSVA